MHRHLIEEAIKHLAAAIAQSCPADDQIIMQHVRDAYAALKIVQVCTPEEQAKKRKKIKRS
jgi:hypothetical protein